MKTYKRKVLAIDPTLHYDAYDHIAGRNPITNPNYTRDYGELNLPRRKDETKRLKAKYGIPYWNHRKQYGPGGTVSNKSKNKKYEPIDLDLKIQSFNANNNGTIVPDLDTSKISPKVKQLVNKGTFGLGVIGVDRSKYNEYPYTLAKDLNGKNYLDKVNKLRKRLIVLNKFNKDIHDIENDKNEGLERDATGNIIYKSYPSVEGGANTVYDGLKLNPGTKVEKIYSKQGYLTEKQAKNLQEESTLEHYNRAKKIYNKNANDSNAWDQLSINEQRVLTDYAYDGTLPQFKNLMKGFRTKDKKLIDNSYIRYYYDNVEKRFKPNNRRNKKFKPILDSITNTY